MKEQPDSSDERTRLLRQTLNAMKDRILAEARADIADHLDGDSRQEMETALDAGDWSVFGANEDLKFSKLRASQETLMKIDESLLKIKEGTYGVCDDCDEAINPARLKILPFAIRCRDCQEDFEEKLSASADERKSFEV